MWTTEHLGLAVWSSGGSSWQLDARGGSAGIGILATEPNSESKSNAKSVEASKGSARFVSFEPVDEDVLPCAAEQYVRGDEWHVNYPQGDGSFALRLAFRPIETSDHRIVLETRLSIQTDLLDTHPKVDVEVSCNDINSFVPGDALGDDEVQGAGSAPISLAKNRGYSTGVLLGPHDSPFTSNHSNDSLLRLRLFGEFLEKGVIRKACPWIVIDRTGTPPSESELEGYWKRLVESPLPLTP